MDITYVEFSPYGEEPTGYKATIDGDILFVPLAEGNRHYIAIQEAIAGGLVVQPASPPDFTKAQFVRQALDEMNARLERTDNFIIRADEYADILPATITGNGSVNAFVFNQADLYARVKGWREDIIQTTMTRIKSLQAATDYASHQAVFTDNPLVEPAEDAVDEIEKQINDMGDFLNTSATGEFGGAPAVNSVYQYRLEMIGIVTQELSRFWMKENANSTMYREAEKIKIGNSDSSYMHEQVIGNPQYEVWYKNVVNQFSNKMQAIFDATTYEEADTAFATAINYNGPYAADQRPMPITWTDKTVGWGRRTTEATDTYNALQSARAKLVALGLTDNEALALCYYEGDDSRMLGEWT